MNADEARERFLNMEHNVSIIATNAQLHTKLLSNIQTLLRLILVFGGMALLFGVLLVAQAVMHHP